MNSLNAGELLAPYFSNIDPIFLSIGIIIIISGIFALLARFLKQPLVPAYVITGLLLGPVLHIINNFDVIKTFSEMGIAFLLFIVGLEIDLSKLKSVGIVASLGGLIQSIMLFSIGLIIALIAGFKNVEAAYIGIIIAFSSTMVVIKILSDKHEIDTIHGRIMIGFLLMEDFMAIASLSILSTLNQFAFSFFLIVIWKLLLLIVIAKAANKWLFPKLFRFAANSQELLFLSALSVCFLFSLFFASLQFSISVGAFVAGVTLANLPYSYEIIGRVKSIRDFFLTLFFVSLGTLLVGIQKNHLIVLGILLAIVWFIKPLITVFITSFFGYKKRTGFLAAVSLTQISEFGLIIATQGMLIGHIQQEIFSIAALLAVITMSATSYFTKYEYFFYSKLQNFLKRFESFSDGQDQLEFSDGKKKYDVLLIGYDRIGYSIVKKLHLLKKELLIVDYNPEVIKRLAREKIHCIYGDISDSEILERINLKGISMVISTSPDKRDNALLIKKAKEANKKIIVFVTSYKVDDAIQLYDAGADYVILPHFLGGEHVSILIETFGNDIRKILRHKFSHIEELKKRQFMGHEQPPVHHTHNVE